MPIVTTTVADSTALSSEDAEVLQNMVDAADLFSLSSSRGADQADRPSYQITVEHEGRENQVTLADADLPDAVRSLASWISSVPGHEQSVAPPGSS